MFILGFNDILSVNIMKIHVPEISNLIYEDDVLKVLKSNYSIIGPLWVIHQFEWINSMYQPYKDHDKYLILIYLINNTLDFYSLNFTKINYEQFYSQDSVEIGRINISEISKALNIPKESTRRKIVELEIAGDIKRFKKKIIIDRTTFKFVRPEKSLKRSSRFLAIFSKILLENEIIKKTVSSKELEISIKENFSYIWKLYYEMQIPMLLAWKKIFNDLETFNIWSACVVNQYIHASKDQKKMNLKDFLDKAIFLKKIKKKGINAMSISDITGIPRATVIRKLNNLIKSKNLNIDNKKQYTLDGIHLKKFLPVQNITMERLAEFSTKIYNSILVN